MCDEDTVRDADEYLKEKAKLSRREFNTLATGAAIIATLPRVANAMAVVGKDVEVTTPDGVADCFFVHPAQGKHPGVLIWPDIMGLRPAFQIMATRLAESGYSVLVVNPFYRSTRAPIATKGASFSDPELRAKIMPYYQALSPQTNVTDAKAFVSYLDKQGEVDTLKKIGTTGYCMGGPMVMRTAGTLPDRIGAGATFHGGGLVTGADNSPHLLIPNMRAQLLIAIAENDDKKEPDAKTVLKKSFHEAGVTAEIEVYEGTLHGWCPPDSRVYNEAQAERAWSRLLALFATALKNPVS